MPFPPPLSVRTLRESALFRLGREFVPVAVGQVLAMAGGLAALRFLTEALPPDEFAAVTIAMTAITLQSLILGAPISASVGRLYAPAKEQGELPSLWNAVSELNRTISLAVLAGIIVIVIFATTVGVSNLFVSIGVVAILSGLVGNYAASQDALFLAARRRWISALFRALDPWSKFGMASAFAVIFSATGSSAMLGILTGITSILLLKSFVARNLLNLSSSVRTISHHRWKKQVISFGSPYAVWGICYWCWSSVDKLALGAFHPPVEIAHYAVLFQLGYASVLSLFGPINQLIQPLIFLNAGTGTDPKRTAVAYKKILLVSLGVFGLGSLFSFFAFLFHRDFLAIFVAEGYQERSSLLPLFTMAGTVFGAAQCLELYFLVELRTKALMRPKVIFFLVGSLLMFLVAYFGGVPEMAAFQLLQALLYLSLMIFLSHRQMRIAVMSLYKTDRVGER